MRAAAVVLILLLGLTGCASQPQSERYVLDSASPYCQSLMRDNPAFYHDVCLPDQGWVESRSRPNQDRDEGKSLLSLVLREVVERPARRALRSALE